MGFVRSSLSVTAAAAMGAGLFLAGPAQAANYPPTKPVRCGAKVDGNKIIVKIRPLKKNNRGYRFEIQKRKSRGNWKIVRTGKTRASDGYRIIRNVDKGRYRLKCYGGPDRLDGMTSSRRVK